MISGKLITAPSFAEIARSRDLTVQALADAIGVSRASVVQLEQNPPAKRSTWLKWSERVLGWVPLLDSAFAEVFRSKAFVHCPPGIVQELRANYLSNVNLSWALIHDSRHLIDPEQYFSTGRLLEQQGDWRKAGYWYTLSARQRYPDNEWANSRLRLAQILVNQGDLLSAEYVLTDTEDLHAIALLHLGKEWEPDTQARLAAIRAWSQMLRGEQWMAVKGFRKSLQIGQRFGDHSLVEQGWHMGARSLIEPSIFHLYFAERPVVQQLNSELVGVSLKWIDQSLSLNMPGSPNEAFGLWYRSLILGLGANFNDGLKLLRRADNQLSQTFRDDHFTAACHSGLSLIHFEILSADGNPLSFRKYANKIRNMLHLLALRRYPTVLADALTTMVLCRIRAGLYLYDNKETADYLMIALLINPYEKSVLWSSGHSLLTDHVLPSFGNKERLSYLISIHDRIKFKDNLFEYLRDYPIDFDALTRYLEGLSAGNLGKINVR